MVHLKKDPSKVSVVMGSIEDVTTNRNSSPQGTHTQTTRPRIRLRKVIFNRKPTDAKPTEQPFEKRYSDTEVQVEDYQITKDGSIIDGATGKYYKIGSPSRSNHKNCARERSSVNNVNPVTVVQPPKDEDTYDCFGKYVASLLRKLNDQDAISLQGEIVNMIVDVHANIPPEEYI